MPSRKRKMAPARKRAGALKRFYSAGRGKEACGHRHRTEKGARECAGINEPMARVEVYRVDTGPKGEKWTVLKKRVAWNLGACWE